MPAELERKLEQQADKKGLKGKSRNAYIYGVMRRTGWVPSTQSATNKQEEKVASIGSLLGKLLSKVVDRRALVRPGRRLPPISPTILPREIAGPLTAVVGTGALFAPEFKEVNTELESYKRPPISFDRSTPQQRANYEQQLKAMKE